jgi:hypothetical protein
MKQKFLGVQNPFYKKGSGRRRQKKRIKIIKTAFAIVAINVALPGGQGGTVVMFEQSVGGGLEFATFIRFNA